MRVWLVSGIIIGLFAGLLGLSGTAQSQSGLDISLEDYLEEVGSDATLVPKGKLVIDGRRLWCGRRPTVLNPKFDSWGGAYPGFVILNPDRLKGLPTPVKFYVYAHECGHQFVGRSEEAADCFAVKRGRRRGWLTADGLEDIRTFISKLKGDWDHAPGTVRCEKMRVCYRNAAPRARASQN